MVFSQSHHHPGSSSILPELLRRTLSLIEFYGQIDGKEQELFELRLALIRAIDRLKADLFGVSEPFLVHIADHDDRGAENARRRGGCEAHRPGACNVDRPQATLKGTETRSPISTFPAIRWSRTSWPISGSATF